MAARDIFLYIGPFAEWEIPESRDRLIPGDGWAAILDDGPLEWNIGTDNGLLIDRDGAVWHRYCAMPHETRAGGPARVMRFHFPSAAGRRPVEAAEDWAGLDRSAEVEWLRTTFAAELLRAAEFLGQPAALRWGLVHWYWP